MALIFTTIFTAILIASNIQAEPSLPAEIEGYLRFDSDRPLDPMKVNPEDFGGGRIESFIYKKQSETIQVSVFEAKTASGAYSFYTLLRSRFRNTSSLKIGSESITSEDFLLLYKDRKVVLIETGAARIARSIEFARALYKAIPEGESDIPVLVKHLPGWEKTSKTSIYIVRPNILSETAGNHAVLSRLSFTAGTEAVLASYGNTKLLLVEYTTPQLAAEQEREIRAALAEGKDATSVLYKRIGNYSLFGFGDLKRAEELSGQIKYEQEVSWVGEDPWNYRFKERVFTVTTANVILTTLKATGLAILICLGVGALLGGTIFMRRRALPGVIGSYSDAGGMTRLNIDELTGPKSSVQLKE
jgi:hypothetical protein